MHWYDDRISRAHRDLVRRAKHYVQSKYDVPSELTLLSAPMGLPDWAQVPRDADTVKLPLGEPEDYRSFARDIGWTELREEKGGAFSGLPAGIYPRRRRRFPNLRFDSGAAHEFLVRPVALRFALVCYTMYDERSNDQWDFLFGYRGRKYHVYGRPYGYVAIQLLQALIVLHHEHSDPLPVIK